MIQRSDVGGGQTAKERSEARWSRGKDRKVSSRAREVSACVTDRQRDKESDSEGARERKREREAEER